MATKYWVGNSGNWSDTAHWSLSSGGAGGAGAPSSEDEVYFDENSFTVPNQTVTADTDVEVAGFYYNLIGYGTVDDDVAGIILNFSDRIIAFADSNISNVSSAFNFTNALFSGRFNFGYHTLAALELLDITNCTFTLTESTDIIGIFYALEPVAPVGYQLSIYTLNYIFLDQVDHGQVNLNSDVDIYIENLNIVNLTTYPAPEEGQLTLSDELYWTIDGQYGPEGGTTVTVKNFNFGWDVRQQDLVTDGVYSYTDYRDISSSAPFGFTIENFVKDKSVLLLGAEYVVLQRVLSDPQLNEYAVSESGEYTFNSGNAGAGVLLDYVFTEEPSGPFDVKSIVFNFDTPYQFMYHLFVTRLSANLVLLDPTPPPEPVFATPKGIYNEGDHFAYAPGDSGGSAVWREASQSSTPVTSIHRPGCGYWFKEVGTVYGGEELQDNARFHSLAWINENKNQYPWQQEIVNGKVEYNEGSYITKSPEISGGTPTWEMGKTGPVITSKHIPCGYWFKDYREYIPAPAPPVTEYYFIHNFETAVDQPDYVWDMQSPADYMLYYEDTILDADAKFGNYACNVVNNAIVGMYYEPYTPTDEFWPPLTYEFWFNFTPVNSTGFFEIWIFGWKTFPDGGWDYSMYQTWCKLGLEYYEPHTPYSYMEDWIFDSYSNKISDLQYNIPFPLGEYVHCAIIVLSDRIKIFYNGVLFKEYISPQVDGFSTMYTDFYLDNEKGSKLLVDAISITKGEKYTENFTPPTEPPSK